MELAASLHEHLRELEERLLRPDARRSRQALDELLSDDFVEFASDGVAYDKTQVIDALEREVPCRRSLADFQIVPLAECDGRAGQKRRHQLIAGVSVGVPVVNVLPSIPTDDF